MIFYSAELKQLLVPPWYLVEDGVGQEQEMVLLEDQKLDLSES